MWEGLVLALFLISFFPLSSWDGASRCRCCRCHRVEVGVFREWQQESGMLYTLHFEHGDVWVVHTRAEFVK